MTKPLRIVIVDDEAPARNRLRDVLADCAERIPLQVAGEAGNGRDALALLAQIDADVVLLDIHMPGIDGLEVAKRLAQSKPHVTIVFTTAFDAHAIAAFELNARDYLLKPVRRDRLLAALQKVRGSATISELPPAAGRLYLSANERGRVLLVPVAEVVSLRAEQKYVAARTLAYTYLLEESLTGLEQEFAGQFVRIHRSILVARNAIAGFVLKSGCGVDGDYSGWVVLLKGLDDVLPVSRRQYSVIKQFRQGEAP